LTPSKKLHSDIAKAFALNVPAEIWARHGAQHPLGDDFYGAQDLIPQVLDKQTVLSHAAKSAGVTVERDGLDWDT
jgi:phthiodiolone/phenolphthiodiolone dimycocerosates ketoreductase